MRIEASGGTVFADLGLPDADVHLVKAGLVARIGRTVRQRGLMGGDQAKISAMLAGQYRGYSVERLMRFLVALEVVGKRRNRGVAEL